MREPGTGGDQSSIQKFCSNIALKFIQWVYDYDKPGGQITLFSSFSSVHLTTIYAYFMSCLYCIISTTRKPCENEIYCIVLSVAVEGNR